MRQPGSQNDNQFLFISLRHFLDTYFLAGKNVLLGGPKGDGICAIYTFLDPDLYVKLVIHIHTYAPAVVVTIYYLS